MKHLLVVELNKIRAEHQLSPGSWYAYLLLLIRLLSLVVYFLKAQLRLRSASHLGQLVFVRGRLKLANQGHLAVANKTRIWGNIHPTVMSIEKDARLTIGEGSFLNGVLIGTKKEVNIGNHDFLHKKVDDMAGIDLNSDKYSKIHDGEKI